MEDSGLPDVTGRFSSADPDWRAFLEETASDQIGLVIESSVESPLESSMASGGTSGGCLMLSKDNYPRWKRAIMANLEENDLLGVTDGSETRVANAGDATQKAKYSGWPARDAKARRIILMTLDDVTESHCADCKTALEIWTKIKKIKEPSNTDAVMTGLLEFLTTSWKHDDDVNSFLAALSVVKNRINATNDAEVKIQDKLMMAKILISLPPQFATFVEAWHLVSKPESKLDDLVEHLRSKERNAIGAKPEPATGGAFFSRAGGATRKQFNGSKVQKPKFKGNCNWCGFEGHKEADCKKKKRGEKSKAEKDAASGSTASAAGASTAKLAITTGSVCFMATTEVGCMYADSGASRHLTGRIEWFTSLRRLEVPHPFDACGMQIRATHVGTIEIDVSPDGHSWFQRTWNDVHYCKELESLTLLSTGWMSTKGYSFYHDKSKMVIAFDGQPIVGGYAHGESYIPYIRIRPPPASIALKAASFNTWHMRLGHPSDQSIKSMVANDLVTGLVINTSDRGVCDACHYGKQTNCTHPVRSAPRDCQPGERFHSDTCDAAAESWNGFKHFITFKDESSGFRKVYFLKSKSEVYEKIRSFLLDAELETGRKCVSFRSDNGTEYCNSQVQSLFSSMNIKHELSAAYVKEGNGVAERENRILCDVARSNLHNLDLSKAERDSLWSEAIGTAAYLRNRIPCRGKTDATPYELWFGRKPDVSHLKVFGAPAFVRIPDVFRKKLDPKAKKGFLVGYDSLTDHIFRTYDPVKGKVERVSNVVIEDGDMDRTAHLFPLSEPLSNSDGKGAWCRGGIVTGINWTFVKNHCL